MAPGDDLVCGILFATQYRWNGLIQRDHSFGQFTAQFYRFYSATTFVAISVIYCRKILYLKLVAVKQISFYPTFYPTFCRHADTDLHWGRLPKSQPVQALSTLAVHSQLDGFH